MNFELSKGNALVVADAVTSGEIRGGSIDFNYTDGFEGKGHGNILFDGDSIHVFCMEDEHGNGRISLNCDTTLTRDYCENNSFSTMVKNGTAKLPPSMEEKSTCQRLQGNRILRNKS